jgi:hypothetical protein
MRRKAMMIPRDTNEYHTNRFCRGENFEKETRKAFFYWGGPFYSATTTMVKTSAARSEDSFNAIKRRTKNDANSLSILKGRKEGKKLSLFDETHLFHHLFKTKEGPSTVHVSSSTKRRRRLRRRRPSLLVQTR